MDPGRTRELTEEARRRLAPARPVPASLEALADGLVARGLAALDPEAGLARLVALFEGQWSTGLLPHRVARAPAGEVPAALAPYRVEPRAHGLPRGVATSCLAAPPVLGSALAALARAGAPVEAEHLERLVFYHHWLLTARDPAADGVVMLLHPLESECPTSLRFRPLLASIEGLADGVPPGHAEDPLLPGLARARGEAAGLAPGHPFRVQDAFATGLLAASTRALVPLARALGRTRDLRRLEAWRETLLAGAAKRFPTGASLDLAGGRPLPRVLAGPAGLALAAGPGRGGPDLAPVLDPAGPFAPDRGRVQGLACSAPPAAPGFDPARPGSGAIGLLEQLALGAGLLPGDPRRVAREDRLGALIAAQGLAEHWHALEGAPVAGEGSPVAAALVLVAFDAGTGDEP